MHGHDRKLDRAGTERIELMEVCPVCGEQRRNSARFCTTCGHRFATDEIAAPVVAAALPDASVNAHDATDPVISGWPAPSSEVEASPWAPPPESIVNWPAPPAEQETDSAAADVTWAEVAATAFGANRKPQPPALLSDEGDTSDEFEVIEEVDVEVMSSEAGNDDLLRQRARSLLRELQEVIEGLTGASESGGDALASELEISLTRPTALEGEALADLRAAAGAAQERPRDLDTLTALTAQAETILALLVGYERTTAGIERAIQSLRAKATTQSES
jgi:hypothetical protein